MIRFAVRLVAGNSYLTPFVSDSVVNIVCRFVDEWPAAKRTTIFQKIADRKLAVASIANARLLFPLAKP